MTSHLLRPATLLLLAAAVLAVAAPSRAEDAPAPAPSPEPVFASLDGATVRVSQHRGKIVLLNFWATYCGPCRTEMPQIQKLFEELSPEGLVVIGAAANGRDEGDLVRRTMSSLGASFETWVWVSAKDMKHYGVGPGIPATLLIDREGAVRHRFQGAITADRLRPLIEAMLAEADLAPAR